VGPTLALEYSGDGVALDPEALGERSVALVAQAANLGHILLGEFGLGMLRAAAVSAVADPVRLVLAGRAVAEVGQLVVGWVAVQVADLLAVWALAFVGEQHEVMNVAWATNAALA